MRMGGFSFPVWLIAVGNRSKTIGIVACALALVFTQVVCAVDDTPKTELKKSGRDWELNKADPLFESIVDGTPLVDHSVKDGNEQREFLAFVNVLRFAHSLPAQTLNEHGRVVPYESLADKKERADFLRELVKVQGKIIYIVERDVPNQFVEGGIGHLYNALIEIQNSPEQRVSLVFSELPPELGLKQLLNAKVEANGYYFKYAEYLVRKKDGTVDAEKKYAPVLLGRSVVVQEQAAVADEEVPEEMAVRLDKSYPYWEGVHDKKPFVSQDENDDEYTAYNVTVKQAAKFSSEVLAKYSRKDVVFADMLSDRRNSYLRELLHVEGTLVRLRKIEATERLKATSSIKELYEGWIVDHTHNDHLIEVVFIDLPEGMKPGELINYRVTFDGYYFKLLRYDSNEKDKNKKPVQRMAPLLIGRSIEMLDVASPWSLANPLIPAMMGMLVVLAIGVVILIIWLRRGDRQVKQRAHEALTKSNPFDAKEQKPLPPIEPGNAWNRMGELPPN